MSLKTRDGMGIVIVGHVDHGKSTIIGRLMADTGSLPDGKLEQVEETCRRNARPFEYAFLLDALEDERRQGITIDTARCFFKTKKRDYIILDAPGHIEFLKNMVTGAARAQAALLVIDALEGVQENSKRHGYLLSMLGITQLSVLVNKMDLTGFKESVFHDIKTQYTDFLDKINVKPVSFIPVSGFCGDNIAAPAPEHMPWYSGSTVLEQLDGFRNAQLPEDKPFRMPIQGVYKFTNYLDDRRIVAGTIETGSVKAGDEIVFYPSGKKTSVKALETFNAPQPETLTAGNHCGFTMTDQTYLRRGEIACRADETKPCVSARIGANIFWLGKKPLVKNKRYYLKLATVKVKMEVEEIVRVLDASSLADEPKKQVDRNEVAECIFKLEKAIAFDVAEEIAETGRFVIIDDYEITGGGIINKALPDKRAWVRNKVILRNNKWEKSMISQEERARKYAQQAALILITGLEDAGKKPIAKQLERELFSYGKVVYFLGIGNLLYGVDADIKAATNNNREEHFRRLTEVLHIMLDAGVILIVTATEVTNDDMEIINTTVEPERILKIWVGEDMSTGLPCDVHIPHVRSIGQEAAAIKKLLQDKGIV